MTPSQRYRARKRGENVPMVKRGPVPKDPWERFSALFVDTGHCWIWRGARGPKGYGRFNNGIGPVLAHRFSYEHARGPIALGLELDHLCRNPGCVNPAHLEPVTSRENTMRGQNQAAVNARKTYCPRGHKYTDENTYRFRNHRQCKACKRERDSARSACQ